MPSGLPPPKKRLSVLRTLQKKHTLLHLLGWQVPLEGWVQIALFIGHMEGYFWRQDAKRAPGDYEGRGGLKAGTSWPKDSKDVECSTQRGSIFLHSCLQAFFDRVTG